jgi:hypothetical protein
VTERGRRRLRGEDREKGSKGARGGEEARTGGKRRDENPLTIRRWMVGHIEKASRWRTRV